MDLFLLFGMLPMMNIRRKQGESSFCSSSTANTNEGSNPEVRTNTLPWKVTKQIPIRFCEASLVCLFHGEDYFLFYLSQYERDVLTKALSTKLLASFQQDAIFGVYEQYNMTCMTCVVTNTRDQLQSHVVTMARYHFVCRPIPSSMRMANGMQGRELEAF